MSILKRLFARKLSEAERECIGVLAGCLARVAHRTSSSGFDQLTNDAKDRKGAEALSAIQTQTADPQHLAHAVRLAVGLFYQEQKGLSTDEGKRLVRTSLSKLGWQTLPTTKFLTRQDIENLAASLTQGLRSGSATVGQTIKDCLDLAPHCGYESHFQLAVVVMLCEEHWIEPLFRAAKASPETHAAFVMEVLSSAEEHLPWELRSARRRAGNGCVDAIVDCVVDERELVRNLGHHAARVVDQKPKWSRYLTEEPPQDAPRVASHDEWSKWFHRKIDDA